ncbi:MAG: ABC transporter ATP-binding protein [Nitrososphaerota archaeon]
MIVAARRLTKYFQLKGTGIVGGGLSLKAVDDISIDIKEGSIVGVVGESGSGKSTLGRLLMALLQPTSGQVLFDIPDDVLAEYDKYIETNQADKCRKIEEEYSIFRSKGKAMKEMRKQMGMVFQDPYSSLDPRMRVEDIITEPMLATGYLDPEKARKRCLELLDEVGLPRDFAFRYPHELSGGQRQRVALARGISTLPKFLVLDEPTSALDVSVQAQILSLLKKIRSRYNISMLLITHNIAVIAYMADFVNVMYAGKVMESGVKRDVILNPTHPYTIALISAVPGRARMRQRIILQGDPPNLVFPPSGCRFHPRCPVAFELCGWTADEVATDLDYLVQGKYYTTFQGNTQVIPKDALSILIKGTNSIQLSEMIASEREKMRSLMSIANIKDTEEGVLISLSHFVTPKMYNLDNGKKVSCLLYSPEVMATQKGAISGN